MIPLFKPPRLTGKYLGRVLESGWLTTGPVNEALKERLVLQAGEEILFPNRQEYSLSEDQVVLASSATAGWQAVCDMIAQRADDALESVPAVAITEATWPGMKQAVDHAGLWGLPTGEDPAPWIDVRTDIGGARSAAHVDQYVGKACCVVHDACHSWLPNPLADFAVMSFYPTKLVPGAEGGVVVCKRAEDAEELEWRLNCGIQPAFGAGPDRVLTPRYCGRKGNMTDVQAALNLEALELAPQYIEDIQAAHRTLAEVADEFGIPYRKQPVRAYLFQVECKAERVPVLRGALAARGIPNAWNFPPAGLITLPCFPGMKEVEAREVIETVKGVL